MSRSVNKAIIVGNLTRDPEMRYTPNGQAVTNFSVATNRRWLTEGQEKEEVEFHNVVAWSKLAELCSQFLTKGRKVFIEGRLQTRNWNDAQGVKHYKTEIVAEDMVILDSRRDREGVAGLADQKIESPVKTESGTEGVKETLNPEEVVNEEEIPF